MKITKYSSRRKYQKGARRKSRKNKHSLEETSLKTDNDENTNNDISKENFKNGKAAGVWELWHDNDQIKLKASFSNGKAN